MLRAAFFLPLLVVAELVVATLPEVEEASGRKLGSEHLQRKSRHYTRRSKKGNQRRRLTLQLGDTCGDAAQGGCGNGLACDCMHDKSGRRLFGAPSAGSRGVHQNTCICTNLPPSPPSPPLPSLPPPVRPPPVRPPPTAPPPVTHLPVQWATNVHSHCTSDVGTLSKNSGSGAWTCAAYTEVEPYQVVSATDAGALRALEFRCGCSSQYVNIGLKSSAYSSWSTLTSNIARTCSSNSDCGYYLAGVDYGFSCRVGTLHTHYANSEAYTNLGSYSSSTVMRVEVDGTTVTWKVDGVVRMTKSLSHSLPLNVFATAHNVDSCSPQVADAALTVV